MVTGCLLAYILNTILGNDVTKIAMVGALPSSLPPLSMPKFSLDTIQDLASTAVAVTLFALTEAVSIGRSLAMRSGQRIDGNQEFIGQGLSNIAGSFFSGYVATGSFNRSGLNYQAGAKTPLAAAFAGKNGVFQFEEQRAEEGNEEHRGFTFTALEDVFDFMKINQAPRDHEQDTGHRGIR